MERTFIRKSSYDRAEILAKSYIFQTKEIALDYLDTFLSFSEIEAKYYKQIGKKLRLYITSDSNILRIKNTYSSLFTI